MKIDMDKIQFESRREIENMMEVINKYKEQNPKDDNETVNQFYGYLEAMHMTW